MEAIWTGLSTVPFSNAFPWMLMKFAKDLLAPFSNLANNIRGISSMFSRPILPHNNHGELSSLEMIVGIRSRAALISKTDSSAFNIPISAYTATELALVQDPSS